MVIMKLNKYDNKRVRIILDNNDIFEGIVQYNSKDYNYHEYGKNMDGLQMICFLFYKNQIKDIEIIDNYTSSYGKLEIETIEDGMDLIDEVLYSEEDEAIYRLLVCIEDNLVKIDYKEELFNLLKYIIKFYNNKKIINKIKSILNR